MLDLYVAIFWIPAIASIILLLVLRRVEGTSLAGSSLLGGWYVTAFAMQYFAHSPNARVLGLVLQVALAIYLSVRLRISE